MPSQFKSHMLPSAICLALALIGAAASLPVTAAPSASSMSAPSIPAGPLAQALMLFAERAGVTLSYSPDQVGQLSSPGLAGGGSLEDGLAALLAGTHLIAQKTPSGYVIVPGKADSDSSLELAPAIIRGTAIQSAFAPVDGYFASNASSASKTDKPILETAQSISVVTSEQIADRKVNTVQDAVAYSAGVRVGSSGLDPRFDMISVRGFETTQSADFLDGLRQPGSGMLALYSTEAYNLERIEVLKGPASVLYGQISPGGMVNRVSKRPSPMARNEVQIQYGNHSYRQGQFDVGGQLDESGDVMFRTVGLFRDAQYSIEQMNNDARLLAPSLTWQIDPDTSLTLIAQYQERETAASPMLYQDGDRLTSFWQGDEYYDKLEQRQWAFGYEFEHVMNETFSAQQNLRYGQVDATNQYLQPTTLSNGRTLERYAVGLYEDMNSLSTDTRLVSRFATGDLQHTLVTGVDYAWIDTSVLYATGPGPSIDLYAPDYHQPVARPGTALMDRDGLEHRSGVYLQDQIELDRWRLSSGLRRDWVHLRYDDNLNGNGANTKTTHSATTGQLGALYLFDNGLAPYASYATSFQPESGFDANGTPYKPTEGEQFEVGVKYQPPGSSTLLTASLYHLTQTNVRTRDMVNPINSVQTGEQVSRGLELEAVSDLTDQLRMTASYAFNDAEVTRSNDGNQGNVPKNVPRHLASLWLDYQLLMGVGLSGGARYTGSTYGNGANTAKNEDYTLVDAGAHYDFGGNLDGVRLALNARNLFDKRYITCDDGFCYRGEARSVITSLSYRW